MKGRLKRFLAMVLSITLVFGNAPLYTAKAATGDVTIIDFCRPTTGAVLYDNSTKEIIDANPVGITDTSLGGWYYIATSTVGTGWRLNTSKTTVPVQSDNPTLYQYAGTTSSTKQSGMHLQKWGSATKPDAQTVLHINFNKTVAFDFTVPEAGAYSVGITYYDHKSHKPFNVSMNDGALEASNIGTTGSTTKYITATIGIVTLKAGDFANTVEITNATNNYYSSMIRSITLTKVDDALAPTPAPTLTPMPTEAPTAEPTATPTVAPTLAPTAVPTQEPTATPAPTLDPNASPEPFVISLSTVDTDSVHTEITDATRYYWTADTKGANWAMHSDTDASNYVVDGVIPSGAARIYPAQTPVYTTLYKALRGLHLSFTAPDAGYYDISTNVLWGDRYGYADVFVNGDYIGTLDGRLNSGLNEQKLLGVYLNAGENANKIEITPTGKSREDGHYYFAFTDVNFTTPNTVATLTGIDASVEKTTLHKNETQTIVTTGKTSNGALYRLSSAGVAVSYTSDNEAVATVSTDGVITAKAIGTAKITATSSLGTDIIHITVQEVQYTTPEINIKEGWVFTEGDALTLEPKAKLSTDTYADADKVTATYETSDENVAKIENGVLKIVGAGTAKITAHITYDGVTLDVSRNISANAYIPPEPFEVDFAEGNNIVTDTEGIRFYFTKDTVGSNWVISSKNRQDLATDSLNTGTTRIYYFPPTYLTLLGFGKEFVVDVDVPIAGAYDITANVAPIVAGGISAIYVNDIYVGSVDCYCYAEEPDGEIHKQYLLGVNLHAGKNTIAIKPIASSGGEKYYSSIRGFSFTAPEQIATLSAIEASANVENMYVGRTEQITAELLLSNGGFYQLAQSTETLKYESSDETVATVSNTGLITGTGEGDVTITVTAENTGLTDTITFDVSPADFEQFTVNITDNENFYVMAERTLEVKATLKDGTPIEPRDLEIVYKSSDETKAKIEDGVLKIVGKGSATITTEVTFRATGEKIADVKHITAETLPLQDITAKTAKPVVQELDTEGVQLLVQGIATDGTIVEDLKVAGFTQRDYTFTALTPEILTIDENGICRYVTRGTAQVKVEAILDGVPFEHTVEIASSSSKTGRTLYTDEMIENARYNAANTSWGVAQVSKSSGKSYRFVYDFEHIYDLIFAEGIPRSNGIATKRAQYDVARYCPACGTNVYELYGSKWETNILENPWKVWCPHCKMQFPSNDFALLYERGLDENGQYNRELAIQRNAEAVARGEKDALVNELYPDKGPLWMVDDGHGWSPSSGTYGTQDPVQYAPVAKYAHDFWYAGSFSDMGTILSSIKDIYLWTGDERYGIAGAILLDRVADVYPSFDITTMSLGYDNGHGGANSGKVVGTIWESYLSTYFIECYDAFYDMYDHPQVVEFLSKKAVELNLDNPKTNGNLIRENIENGVIRTAIQGVIDYDIHGNFGMYQTAMAKAAVALDTQPETDEALLWLTRPSDMKTEELVDPYLGYKYVSYCYDNGGDLITKFVNAIDRDGFGQEVSYSYNKIWLESVVEIADVLRTYGTDVLDLYDNPKFVNMYASFIYMTAGDGYTLSQGDGGQVCQPTLVRWPSEVARGYRALRDPLLAQIYDYYVSGKYSEVVIDIYADQRELITAMQADVAEYGKLDLESLNLTGYGLAMLRGGKAATKENQFETRYDTWMYYGRTDQAHGHLDMLQLGIDAYGFNFTPDMGYPETTGRAAHRHEWVRASISHNLVLVNEESQEGVYTGTPLHFDSTENVKLLDVEAPDAYKETEIYRRTAITIKANDDVSYTVDLFRVKGGDAHTYSFHTQGYKGWSTDDIDLVPQIDEKGQYVGTYAGADVPFGKDPYSTDTNYSDITMYPRGYTWITDVNRGTDKTGDGAFTIDFKQKNFKHQVVDAAGLALKVHGVNDWVADSIDIAVGSVPRKPENFNRDLIGLDHLFIQRRGENLDTLFATVLEPYKVNEYIYSAESLTATIKEGAEGEDDISKVIKVTHHNGRVDYIIYATNNGVTYNVTDGNVNFDFAGFVGVYTVDYAGNNIFTYVNDGTLIGNQTSVGAYTGTVVDFTKELVLDDYIIIKPEQEIEDLSVLENQYIYVDNEGAKCNGSYRILSAEWQGENIALYLGNCSLIESYIDDYDLDAGFVYTIADGQSFRIPVSVTEGATFTGTSRPASGGTSTPADIATTEGTTTEEAVVIEETVLEVEDSYVPSEGTGTDIKDIGDESGGEEVVKPTEAPTEGTEGGNGEGTPTPTPDATDVNADGNGVRNILLGGLGVAALGAGLFFILLGKKKDKDEEEV